jgi:signal transduction histidine kinase
MDLRELVAAVTHRLADEAEAVRSPVRLTAGDPVPGAWDRRRLDQVVTNLVTNAIKYGKGKPIELEVAAAPGRAFVRVIDHGIGVSRADCARIFGRFERAVSSKHYSGLGLGLWIAREIVEAHGGTIEVEETPGGGATFTVELAR